MITEEMINNFTSMFTWNEPGITNYFCAFYTHHRILNDVLEKMNEETSIIHHPLARVSYELCKLLEDIHDIDDEKVKEIYQVLIVEKDVLENFDANRVFINYRYLENRDDKFVFEHVSYIKGLLLAVEKIYLKYYQNFNFAELTYGSM